MLTEDNARIAMKLRTAGHPEAAVKFVACSRKKSYATLEGAVTFATKTAPRDGSYRPRVYKCVYCPGFHLTTKSKEELAQPKNIAYVTDKAYAEMRGQRDKAISELVKLREEYERLKNAPAVFSGKKSWWESLKEKIKLYTPSLDGI